MELEMNGCDLCGDFPAELHARCHPTAPLRIEKLSETEVVLYCYVPSCNREVARLALNEPSISVHGAPIAVRGLSNGHTEPVIEWTRMPSGAYVVLAGSANNFDSFWFDTNGKHPKSELIFESHETSEPLNSES